MEEFNRKEALKKKAKIDHRLHQGLGELGKLYPFIDSDNAEITSCEKAKEAEKICSNIKNAARKLAR